MHIVYRCQCEIDTDILCYHYTLLNTRFHAFLVGPPSFDIKTKDQIKEKTEYNRNNSLLLFSVWLEYSLSNTGIFPSALLVFMRAYLMRVKNSTAHIWFYKNETINLSPLLSFSFGVHFYKHCPNRIINIPYSCVSWLIKIWFLCLFSSFILLHYIGLF